MSSDSEVRPSGGSVPPMAMTDGIIGPAPAAAQATPPRELGPFVLETTLGVGGQAVVYRAIQKALDRPVALKVLSAHLAADPQYISRFHSEAKMAARMRHRNIVSVYDSGADEGFIWLAMEYVDGSSLAQILKRQRGIQESQALAVARDVALAMECAAQHGILHRDIKPQNVLLTSDGTVKLADLGMAKDRRAVAQHQTMTGVVMGTPLYMSPEQVLGVEEVDVRSDIYALGIVLFEMLTGVIPLASESSVATMMRHAQEEVPPPSAVNPSLAATTDRIVRVMTARERGLRYPDVSRLVADLEAAVKGKAPPFANKAVRRLAAPGSARAVHAAAPGVGDARLAAVESGALPTAGAPGDGAAGTAAVRRLERPVAVGGGVRPVTVAALAVSFAIGGIAVGAVAGRVGTASPALEEVERDARRALAVARLAQRRADREATESSGTSGAEPSAADPIEPPPTEPPRFDPARVAAEPIAADRIAEVYRTIARIRYQDRYSSPVSLDAYRTLGVGSDFDRLRRALQGAELDVRREMWRWAAIDRAAVGDAASARLALETRELVGRWARRDRDTNSRTRGRVERLIARVELGLEGDPRTARAWLDPAGSQWVEPDRDFLASSLGEPALAALRELAEVRAFLAAAVRGEPDPALGEGVDAAGIGALLRDPIALNERLGPRIVRVRGAYDRVPPELAGRIERVLGRVERDARELEEHGVIRVGGHGESAWALRAEPSALWIVTPGGLTMNARVFADGKQTYLDGKVALELRDLERFDRIELDLRGSPSPAVGLEVRRDGEPVGWVALAEERTDPEPGGLPASFFATQLAAFGAAERSHALAVRVWRDASEGGEADALRVELNGRRLGEPLLAEVRGELALRLSPAPGTAFTELRLHLRRPR